MINKVKSIHSIVIILCITISFLAYKITEKNWKIVLKFNIKYIQVFKLELNSNYCFYGDLFIKEKTSH